VRKQRRKIHTRARRPFVCHLDNPDGGAFLLEAAGPLLQSLVARAHGMWTYKPRQGRKAATVVCSTSAVVTLAFSFTIDDLRFTIAKMLPRANRKS